MQQQIHFCKSRDGARIAYAIHGSGPPLVKGGHWLTHLEHDWASPVWRHWLEALGRDHTVIRYDDRGCGLSDWDVDDFSAQARVDDLEAVIEANNLDRFALFGMSGSGPTTTQYSAEHPERVTRLLLYGTYARGPAARNDPNQAEEARVLRSLISVGWGKPNPVFRRVFSNLFIPEGTEEQRAWYEDLQRLSTSPENAAKIRGSRENLNIEDIAARVQVPTLVLHAREDGVIPFEEGRRMAALIPGARFVPLDSKNHLLLPEEPAWQTFLSEVREFLPPADESESPVSLDGLTEREIDVLRLVARGETNEEIAEALTLSERTIERHLSNIYTKLGLTGRAARAGAAAMFSRVR